MVLELTTHKSCSNQIRKPIWNLEPKHKIKTKNKQFKLNNGAFTISETRYPFSLKLKCDRIKIN